MAEPLSIAASATGVVVPAFHGIRLLLDDVQRLVDAPRVVENLKKDLASLEATVQSLEAIDGSTWMFLGDTIATQSKTAVQTCDKACETFRDDLKRWTRRSSGGKLSWRDRARIGFFKEHQIKSISEHLQSCKLTCSCVVGTATLYSSIRHTRMTQEIQDSIARRESDVFALVRSTNTRAADVETSLANMRIDNSSQQAEVGNEDEDDDAMSAATQLEDELNALKSSQALLYELLSRLSKEEIKKVAESGQTGAVNVTFGNHNSGIMVGVSNAPISGVNIGQPRQ